MPFSCSDARPGRQPCGKSLPCPAGGPCPCTGTGVFFPRRDCFFRKNTAPCVFSGQRRNTSTPARAADGQDARNIRLCLQAGHAGAVSSVMPRLPAALKYRSPCRAPVLNSFPLFTGAKEAKLQLRHIALRRPYCPEDSAGQKMQVQERLRPCRTVLRRPPRIPEEKGPFRPPVPPPGQKFSLSVQAMPLFRIRAPASSNVCLKKAAA